MSLTVRGLKVALPGAGQREILHSVDLNVRSGEIVGILGHAGSGKSVLVSAIAGAMPLSGGTIEVAADKRDSTVPVAALGERPEELFVAATAIQEVEFALELMRLSPECRTARCARALSAVGLDAARFGQRDPHTLSTGEQRRLALAAVLAVEPAYLCLDDPVAGLDNTGREAVIVALQKLKAEGMGIIVAARDSGFLWRVSDRLLILDAGYLTESPGTDSPGEIANLMRKRQFEIPENLALWILLVEQGLISGNVSPDVEAMASALCRASTKGCKTSW